MKLNKKEEKAFSSKARNLQGPFRYVTIALLFSFSAFYLYTLAFGIFSSESHRGMYLLFTLVLCFLLYPAYRGGKQRVTAVDVVLSLLAIASVGYWILEYPRYVMRVGNPETMDLVMGAITILLSIELARRVVGYILPVLAVLFLLYAYFGPYVPGMLGHYGFSGYRIVESVAAGMSGIYGGVLNTFATYIFPFIVFASFLQAAGGGRAIENIACAVAGGTRGGPAKISVLASGLIGSITGSSAANAVITGSYTIPLMKRTGYRAHTAAGIEAAASTGGQFMPPIMGAGAFLIAAFTETPYVTIMMISFVPAFLYFLGVGAMVHFIAARRGLKGLPKDQIPPLWATLLREGYLLIPVILVFVLLIIGTSIQRAAFLSILATVLLSYVGPDNRMTPKRLFDTMVSAAKNSLAVGATAGVIGILMGVVTMTGLGVKFSSFIISLSGGILPLTILFIAIAGYILGMGITITPTYILLSVLAVPALVALGVDLIPAHLAVFWLVNTGGVTPPVALVAFAASTIAECDPAKAGNAAVRLAAPLFVMPFLFIYTPILFNGPLPEVIETIVTCTIGIVAFAGMMQGYWAKRANVIHRVLLGLAALLLFIPSLAVSLLGLGVLVFTTFINSRVSEQDAAAQAW